ncbi:MAG: TRAP transporter small permease [Dehalococcoidales bacterium]|nr:TRAP transporter small permease [Dehalococcoidales bacterium]
MEKLIKIAGVLDRTLDLLSKLGLLLSGMMLLYMSINVTYGVIKRYVFHDPSIIAIEMVKILLIPACVLAVSYVQRNGRHLKVDFLMNRFSPKIQLIISEVAVPLMGLFVGIVLVWKGWESAVYSFLIYERSMSVWSEPVFPVRFTIPVGYGLLCLIMIGQLVHGISLLIKGKAPGSQPAPGDK